MEVAAYRATRRSFRGGASGFWRQAPEWEKSPVCGLPIGLDLLRQGIRFDPELLRRSLERLGLPKL